MTCISLRNPSLRDCCGRILRDYHDKLIECPGSPGNHHNYPGGLIQHIHGVTRNAWAILQAYPDLEADPDLVLFGGLLHDMGKTVTYGMEDGETVFRGNSDALLGHTYFGVHIVQAYLDEYDLAEAFKYQVLHMIGSHMKEYGDGCVLCRPKMLEVVIVNFADNSDALLTFGIDVLRSMEKGEGREAKGAGLYLYKSMNPCFLPEDRQQE